MEKYKKLKKHIADFYGVSVKALDPAQGESEGMEARMTLCMCIYAFTFDSCKKIGEDTKRSKDNVIDLISKCREQLRCDYKFYEKYSACVDQATDLNLI